MALNHSRLGSIRANIRPRDLTARLMPVCGLISMISILLLGLSTTAVAQAETENNATNATGFSGTLLTSAEVSLTQVLLDISPSASGYIEGAVSISYDDFFAESGKLKSASEIAALLGDAGIKSSDSIVITGECLPCGNGPTPAFFTYWLLKYLGHENVSILEGGKDDWVAAGRNLSDRPAIRPKTDYITHLNPELLATYEFVANGIVQIVDARPSRDYEIGSIPEAINIPYENFLTDDKSRLKYNPDNAFAGLKKDQPVVVFTNIGVEASIVWFALNNSGYDARLYTWRDWLENQPKFGYELVDIVAKPNPVRSGQSVAITASFQETGTAQSYGSLSESSPENDNSSEERDEVLTIKGCATCGFGSPQGFANIDRKDGFVQIGSTGKTSTTATGVKTGSTDGTLRCTAVINGPDGSEVSRTSLLHTSGEKYSGIWSADTAPGVYKVSIVATVSANSETFANVLDIEVAG